MKKYYLIVLAAILIIGGFLYQKGLTAERSTSVTRHQCQTATTSPAYLTAAAASSTCTIDITTVKNADLHVFLVASSSASKLNLAAYETYDELDSTTNWFGIHNYSDSGVARTWGGTPLYNIVAGNAVSSSTSLIIPYSNLRGNRLKLEYSATVANGAVYLEFIKDND